MSPPRRRMTFLLLACVACVAAFTWLHFRWPDPRKADTYAALLHNLAEVETGLANGMSPETMARLADNIQSEIQQHPLPPGDEFEFGGQLTVRYLRTLSAIEGYRRLKLAIAHVDPLDPKS